MQEKIQNALSGITVPLTVSLISWGLFTVTYSDNPKLFTEYETYQDDEKEPVEDKALEASQVLFAVSGALSTLFTLIVLFKPNLLKNKTKSRR